MRSKILQIKVTLKYAKPPIWRRVEVPGDVTLGRFHDILQVVMGWTDSHLHQFVAGKNVYGPEDPEFGLDRKDENKVFLSRVIKKPKDKMIYEYDFGDGWEHEVVVEAVLPAGSMTEQLPRVTAGRRACPPEDCGGIPGLTRLLVSLADPKHPEYEDSLEWTGGAFEPEHFDLEETNLMLRGASS